MHPSLVVLFAVIVAASSASLGQGNKVFVKTSQNNVVVANENGQKAIFSANQQGALKEINGPQTLVIQLAGSGRITKTVEVPDNQVATEGISQSDILEQIFQQNNGEHNELSYQNLLDSVAAKVAKGKVNPAVLVALETVSPRNQEEDTAANQILKLVEQKQLEKEALTDALNGNDKFGRLGSDKVVVEAGIDDILVANSKGQQVNIATKQQTHLNGPQTIQIQVTGPGIIPRAIQVVDQQVAQGQVSQSELLQQIANRNSGVHDGQSYQAFLNQIAAAASNGQVHPAVLATLEAVAPQKQGNTAVVNQILDEAQQIASQEQNTFDELSGFRGYGQSQSEKVLVEEDRGKIVVANKKGQQVFIATNQQAGLNGEQIIEIQITDPATAPKTIQIIDRQVAHGGILQSDILKQIARQNSGVLDEASYQMFFNTISRKVANGEVNPAILAALATVSPQNQLSQLGLLDWNQVQQDNAFQRQDALQQLERFGRTSGQREWTFGGRGNQQRSGNLWWRSADLGFQTDALRSDFSRQNNYRMAALQGGNAHQVRLAGRQFA